MPEPRSIVILLAKELREAWGNRWFLLYSAAFTALALAMAWLGVAGVMAGGFAGLARTAASLVNLVILIVPLMGLTLGAHALAGERERGSLLYLLAQPVDASEVVLGKLLGLAAAVIASLLLGFGVAGLAIAGRGGGEVWPFLAFLGLAVLLSAVSVSVGLLISALASRVGVAIGVAVFLWLALVFLGDLGLMGTSLVLELSTAQLLAATLVNPLQVFKVAAILVIRGGLEVLGPAGLYAARAWGDGLIGLLVAILLLWILLPSAAAVIVMQRRGGLP